MMAWDRFKCRWLLGEEFSYPERPENMPTPPGSLNYCNNQDPICEAAICPNSFDTADAHEWDTVLGVTPWWATPFNNNKCDDIFAQGFGN